MQTAKRWDSGSRWPAVMLMIVLAAVVAGALVTHAADLSMAVQQTGQLVTAANAWLSTTAAQAFTMQCTHAVR